jgi:hypothetical protein
MSAPHRFIQRQRPAFEGESFDAIMAEIQAPWTFRRFYERRFCRLAYNPRNPPGIRRGDDHGGEHGSE